MFVSSSITWRWVIRSPSATAPCSASSPPSRICSIISGSAKRELIGTITQVLLRKALVAARSWPEDIFLSFNLSMRDLVSQVTILQIVALIESSGIDPRSPRKANAPPIGWLIFSGLTAQAFFPTVTTAMALPYSAACFCSAARAAAGATTGTPLRIVFHRL